MAYSVILTNYMNKMNNSSKLVLIMLLLVIVGIFNKIGEIILKRILLVTLLLSAIFGNIAFAAESLTDKLAPGLKFKDAYTVVGDKNLYTGYSPLNQDGTINTLTTIPTGTNAKWEINMDKGCLVWDMKDNKPRVIQYMGYPGNFGIIPRTMAADKDVLAVLVLGEPLARGTVAKAKVIGAIKLVNTRNAETDKIIAVYESSPLYKINSLTELDQQYPGVTTIIETWFVNYNGKGKMKSLGFIDADRANDIVSQAVLEFK